MQTYHGSCHCGAVSFEVDADLSKLVQCTCSICVKKGGLFVRLPDAQFRLLSGEGDLTLYQFNTKTAKHLFCKHCGVHSFGHPRTAPSAYLVNVRCLDDFDLEAANPSVVIFDGRNWDAAFARIQETAERAG